LRSTRQNGPASTRISSRPPPPRTPRVNGCARPRVRLGFAKQKNPASREENTGTPDRFSGGWLRNVENREKMQTSWAVREEARTAQQTDGFDLTLIARLNLNDIKRG